MPISSNRCYRCGGGGHMARACRDPVKCFQCGRIGHKQLHCPSRTRASSTLSGTALAQSWISMVYHDDSSIRNSEYSGEEMNEELFNFNLNYLKLRKSIALFGAADSIYWLRLLDGLSNSSYKASTITSLLLEDATSDIILDSGMKDLRTGDFCDFSFPLSNKTNVLFCEDVLLLDPVVDHYCHNTTPYDPSSVDTSSSLIYSTMLTPFAASLGENVESDMEAGCICLPSYTDDNMLHGVNALALPFSSAVEPVMPRFASTDLALFNSFELLGCCVVDEISDSVVDVGSIGPTVEAPTTKCATENLGARLVVDKTAGEELQQSRAYLACFDVMASKDFAVFAGTTDVDRCSVSTAAASDCLMDSGKMSVLELVVSRAHDQVCKPTDVGDVLIRSVTEPALAYALSPTDVRDIQKKSFPLSCCEPVLAAGPSNVTDSGSGLANASKLLVRTTYLDNSFVPTSAGVVGSCEVTPPSGRRRGRKKKGFYECSAVQRSARLGGSGDRTLHSGDGLPESGAIGIAVSGSGIASFLGSTYSPRALNSLSTSDMLALARNSGFTFDDVQLDTDLIRARELERVNSLSS